MRGGSARKGGTTVRPMGQLVVVLAVGCLCGVRLARLRRCGRVYACRKIGAVSPPLRGGIDLDRPPLEGGATNCGLLCLRAPLSDSPLLLLVLLLCSAGV